MASSQVQVSSSSPFGSVLRDHNQRDVCRGSNLRSLVRDHLHGCSSISSGSEPKENSLHQMNNIDNWVRSQEKTSPVKSRMLEHWAAKQTQMVSSKDQSLPRSFKVSNLGASSLVQLWEKKLNQTNNVDSHSASISELSRPDHTSPAEVAGDSSYERFDDTELNNDSITPPNIPIFVTQNTNLDAGEKEKVRVADIIRRLIAVTQTQSPLSSSWSEENDLLNNVACRDRPEHRRSSKVINSPRLRGRQAFADLLMQMERDKHAELGVIVERHAVSKFLHRGRIQSMLRLRLLQRQFEVVGQENIRQSVAANKNRFGEALMIHMRQRFTTEDESGKKSNLNNLQPDQGEHCKQQVEVIQGQNPMQGHDSVYADAPQHGQEEVSPSSNRLWNQTSIESHNLDSIGTAESISLIEDLDEMSEEVDVAPNFDWFSDISRPRSYWEDRRKEWYQEILSSGSDNEDIRQLLERKTVSTFLVSEFRERMDRLMVRHLEQQVRREEEQDEENQARLAQTEGRNENEGEEGEEGEEEHVVEQQAQDQEREDEEEEETEEESLSIGQQELTYDFDQSTSSLELPSPLLLRSWSFQDNKVSEQCSPCMNNHHPSLVMEAMYDMRKQMKHLYEEMSEMRKSINRCMEMQLDLQKSLKHQVKNNSEQETNNSSPEVMRKRQCCICYEMQVNSLLYRCGHICTCHKCAHELQCSSGKCPICRASIVDVVRTYVDS